MNIKHGLYICGLCIKFICTPKVFVLSILATMTQVIIITGKKVSKSKKSLRIGRSCKELALPYIKLLLKLPTTLTLVLLILNCSQVVHILLVALMSMLLHIWSTSSPFKGHWCCFRVWQNRFYHYLAIFAVPRIKLSKSTKIMFSSDKEYNCFMFHSIYIGKHISFRLF